jgi:hypothetical protein
LQQLVEQIAGRIGRALERRGLVERDLENAWLARDTESGPLDDLLGRSITYRIAVGPRAGQKLFTLQTVAPRLQGPEGEPNGAARAGGFSLHAGLGIASHQREKLERLSRYVSRPPVAGTQHKAGYANRRGTELDRMGRLKFLSADREFEQCSDGLGRRQTWGGWHSSVLTHPP